MRRLAIGFLVVVSARAAELTVAQRNDACYALRGQRTPEVVAEMRRAIGDPVVRSCAARNLREAGAVEALIDALETGAPDTRVAAAHELAAMRDTRALESLGRAAMDANALVASSAIAALGDYENRAALPYLLKAAELPTVAGMTALEQAARLHDKAVLPVARTVLARGDVAAQVVTLGIIADLGDASDLPALREMEKHSEPVSARGRGFGFMPAIDLARAARTAIERIGQR
jgi:HEAT repeat protein